MLAAIALAAATQTTATTVATPAAPAGIGASLWAGSDRITVAPGHTATEYVAFFSTGPAETAKVSVSLVAGAHTAQAQAALKDISVTTGLLSLPAKPATPVTLKNIPNGAGGTETLTTPNAYVFVPVTITVPANAAAYTYTSGDAYETITGQVQVAPAAGITTSPGAGLALAVSY